MTTETHMNFLSFLDIPLATANKFYSWGWKASLIGAAITLIGVILLMWGTRVRDHDFEANISQLNTDAAKANERAAQLENDAAKAREKTAGLEVKAAKTKEDVAQAQERAAKAEQKAAEAQLALEKFKAPRILTTAGQERITSKMASFHGMSFDVATTTAKEPLNLAEQIEIALKLAKWTQLEWTGGPISRNGKPMVGHAIETGVTIQVEIVQKEQLLGVAKALAAALRDEGIAAEAQLMPIPRTDNHSAIHIVVGDKP